MTQRRPAQAAREEPACALVAWVTQQAGEGFRGSFLQRALFSH